MATPNYPTPASLFNIGSPDYNQAYIYVKSMYSYLNSQGDCCATIPRDALYKLTPMLQSIEYDAANDLNNVARWQDGIKSSYYLLFQYV